MRTSFNRVVETYNYIFTDLADPRTNNFLLIPSPWPIWALTGLYLYFCTSFGPRYMKDRKPYNLKYLILVYNALQVCLSAFLFYEGATYLSSDKFSFRCAPVDYSDDPVAVRITSASWWYFFSKVTEFLDTIFFVLKKKNDQVSFLHVYHHSLMATMTWVGVKYIPGGHGIVMGTLNAFVHVVMYAYYLIAGLGPQYQKYLWWKKHVTVLQLVQFVIIVIHSLNTLFSDCPYPKLATVLVIINALLFINLFGRFYYATYIKASDKNGFIKNGSVKNDSAEYGPAKNETCANGSINKHGLDEMRADKNGLSLNGKHKNI